LVEPGEEQFQDRTGSAMNYALKIQIAIAILCIAEAWLEEVVILLKNPALLNYRKLNKKEHQRSGAFWFAQVLLFIALSWGNVHYWYVLIIALIANRRIFFEYSLKLFRSGKRIRDIEGDQFWDRISQRVFGKSGGYWELAVLVTGIILLNKFFLL
jgi:hypothetical protein